MLSLMAIGDVPGCASAEVTWREVATTSIADPLVEMWADQSATIVPPPPPQPNHRHLHSNISELFGKKAKSFNSTWLLTWDTLLTLILPYSIIFVLAIVGNLLVIITLTMNRSMRSVTNIFLLNLAISDLLLGVFCLPFTLVGVLLRRFIFGAFFCHLLSYLQGKTFTAKYLVIILFVIQNYSCIGCCLGVDSGRNVCRTLLRHLPSTTVPGKSTDSSTCVPHSGPSVDTGHYYNAANRHHKPTATDPTIR